LAILQPNTKQPTAGCIISLANHFTFAYMQQVIDFISGYIKMSEDELRFIADNLQFTSFEKGEILLKQGEILNKISFIVKGAVRGYFTDENGTEHTLGFALENQPLVAFDSFTQQTPIGFTSVALENTDTIWISQSAFYNFLETYPRYEKVLRTIISQYMTIEGDKTKLLRIISAKERYKALLETHPELVKRVPLKYIASYLGITIETLSRIRAKK
jgi:CRP-like cAMP-binding protein